MSMICRVNDYIQPFGLGHTRGLLLAVRNTLSQEVQAFLTIPRGNLAPVRDSVRRSNWACSKEARPH